LDAIIKPGRTTTVVATAQTSLANASPSLFRLNGAPCVT
jgi:hypothetical protein